MQTCYNCGKQVSDDTLICPECGALVRRYTTPPNRGAFAPDARPDEPSAPQPYSPQPDAQDAPPRGQAVWRDAYGRVRFSGILTFWLVIVLLAGAYLALSYGCTLILYHTQDMYAQFLSMMPEFSYISEIFPQLVAVIGQYYPLFVVMLLISVCKTASAIWLLAGKRQAAWRILLGSDVGLCLLMLFVSPVTQTLLFTAGLAVTFFTIRPWRSLLR